MPISSVQPRLEQFELRIVPATWLPQPEAAPVAASVISLEAQSWSADSWSQDTSMARTKYGLYGLGQTVAIIDSGIAYDHYALGGGLGSSYRVVGGWDFAENDANPYDDGPLGFHGTHVAGIVASNDAQHSGIAPNVDLVALRVFDDFGNGNASWITSALAWVHQHKNAFRYPITTVNLSLGITNVDAPTRAAIDAALAILKDDGLFISVASGNDFSGNTQVKYPASSVHAVPVSSVGPHGGLSSFSMRDSRVLAAPGEFIVSTVPDYLFSFNGVTDDFLAASGTSMAAPHVAGASVLLREMYDRLGIANVSQHSLYQRFYESSDVIHDPATQGQYRRLNLQAALDQTIGLDEDAPGNPIGIGTLSTTLQFQGTIHSLQDVDTFRFVAARSGTVTVEHTWTAATNHRPQLTLAGAVPIAPGRYQVTAGQTYELRVSQQGSIGKYGGQLSLQAPHAPPIAAAPASNSNQSHQLWTATTSGVHQITIQVAAPQRVSEIRILDRFGQIIFQSSSVQNVLNLQVHLNAGDYLRFAISGLTPVADVSISAISVTNGGGPGGHAQFSILAAVFVVDGERTHTAALARTSEIAWQDTDVNQATDEAMQAPIDPLWLPAMVAGSRPKTGTDITERRHHARECDERWRWNLFADDVVQLTSDVI